MDDQSGKVWFVIVGDHPEDVAYLVWWVTFLGLVGDYQGDSWLPSFGS